MDLAVLLVAFGLGFVATMVRLPPLVGYLAAGFVLHAFGQESTATIEVVSELGILLLLFGIGLKLDLRTLVRPEVGGTAIVQAVAATLLPGLVLLAASLLGVPLADDLDLESALIVAFGLSFSSTVFAIKTMERLNESGALSGRIAIGVLVIQDIFAVAFIVYLGDSLPSPWALVVIAATLALRPVFGWLLDRTDHGEMLIMFGFVVTIGMSTELFEAVDLKPDLGALFIGIVFSGHRRASELSERLLEFKDLFLVAFFVGIGLEGTPSGSAWLIGLVLVALIPLRSALLFGLLTRFRLRARTALHSSLTLSTYSEFGLIVAAAAVSEGRLDSRWLAVLAVAVSGSFIVASGASAGRYQIYDRYCRVLTRFERVPHLSDDDVIEVGVARVMVFGMGRVGTGAFDELVQRGKGPVLGVDRDASAVADHLAEGRNVVIGDALDRDFWERVRLNCEVELVFAATSNHAANLQCVRRIREFVPDAKIASIAMYPDQIAELQEAGVDVARNLFEEAGQALADDAVNVIWP